MPRRTRPNSRRTQPLRLPRNALNQFLFPEENETCYWWQGENAAIASLSAAASACLRVDGVSAADRLRLQVFANDQLAWVLGRNNPEYHSDFPNLPGGRVNGITSGWSDETDLVFPPTNAPPRTLALGRTMGGSPHTGWFLRATASAL